MFKFLHSGMEGTNELKMNLGKAKGLEGIKEIAK